jgi:hypothetical protein
MGRAHRSRRFRSASVFEFLCALFAALLRAPCGYDLWIVQAREELLIAEFAKKRRKVRKEILPPNAFNAKFAKES